MLALLSVPPVRAGDPHVLVLGRISDDPKSHYEQLKPLLDYVVPRLADVGIREGRILMARDEQQMTSYMRRGRVDWVTETAGTGMMLAARNGVNHYWTVCFARRDSGIDSLAQLRGHTIAFQNTSSTSAYFVPAIELMKQGMHLEILLSPMDRPADDSVGYVFARSELNISTWVDKRLVDAGCMSNLDWNNPLRVPASYRRELKVLEQSGEYPRALELVRGDLDPKVQARLRQVLIEAASDPAASDALLQFFQTTRFMPIDPVTASSLHAMRNGVEQVRKEVE